jgi:signal transduction histidine kinase/ligand-binding sensor protein
MDAYASEEQRYRKQFTDTIQELNAFLRVFFSSLFSEWGSPIVLPWGAWDEYRAFEDTEKFSPFCRLVRETLEKRELCYDCDDRASREAAAKRKPLSYWCHWGLRDVAVPIMAHGVSVGTILAGQARLDGPEDADGERKMEAFARDNYLSEFVDDLREARRQCPAVSTLRLEELKRVLWATSQFISQVLYTRPDGGGECQTDAKLTELWGRFVELSRSSNAKDFWKDLRGVLQFLVAIFECRGVLILLTEGEETAEVCSVGIGYKLKIPPGSLLITAGASPFGGPQHVSVEAEAAPPDCPVVSRIIQQCPTVELLLFEKARVDDVRTLHFIIFFDRAIPRTNNLLLHEKKQVLSQFVFETVNCFVNIERIKELKDDLAKRNALLTNIAHQIVQPLHGIVAHCDNLASGTYSAERAERVFLYLLYRAKHLSVLARSVAYAARAERDIFANQQPQPARWPLSRLLIENAITFQGYGEESNISVHVRTERTNLVGEVSVDKERLEMVLTNVLFNAVKYSFPGTQVTIWAEREPNRGVLVFVSNLGIEIASDKWERVFEREYRTPTAKKFSQGGLGIGLFVTRELMRTMKGDICIVESAPTGQSYKGFFEHRNTFALTLGDAS